jgi:hypothetical protein
MRLISDATVALNFAKLVGPIGMRCAMATLRHSLDNYHSLTAIGEDPPVASETIDARRARRAEALKHIAGIWANRLEIPEDGLEYERATRDQWQR